MGRRPKKERRGSGSPMNLPLLSLWGVGTIGKAHDVGSICGPPPTLVSTPIIFPTLIFSIIHQILINSLLIIKINSLLNKIKAVKNTLVDWFWSHGNE
jgi:hypothetical protein